MQSRIVLVFRTEIMEGRLVARRRTLLGAWFSRWLGCFLEALALRWMVRADTLLHIIAFAMTRNLHTVHHWSLRNVSLHADTQRVSSLAFMGSPTNTVHSSMTYKVLEYLKGRPRCVTAQHRSANASFVQRSAPMINSSMFVAFVVPQQTRFQRRCRTTRPDSTLRQPLAPFLAV